jgi:hypothetical protein
VNGSLDFFLWNDKILTLEKLNGRHVKREINSKQGVNKSNNEIKFKSNFNELRYKYHQTTAVSSIYVSILGSHQED